MRSAALRFGELLNQMVSNVTALNIYSLIADGSVATSRTRFTLLVNSRRFLPELTQTGATPLLRDPGCCIVRSHQEIF